MPEDDPAFFNQDSPFSVTWDLDQGSPTRASSIELHVVYTTNSTASCSGIRVQRDCILRPATLQYPVQLENGVLTLGVLVTNMTVKSFQPQENTTSYEGNNDNPGMTIGGLYLAATNLFTSNATYHFGGPGIRNADMVEMLLPDTLSNQFITSTTTNDSVQGLDRLANTYPKECISNWTDPTNYLLTSLNEIAFRVSLNAASFPYRNMTDGAAPPPLQTITMLATGDINVFRSEHKYLIANTVLTLFFIVLVVPSFMGLSPASSFDHCSDRLTET
jgi:hypothetical protein